MAMYGYVRMAMYVWLCMVVNVFICNSVFLLQAPYIEKALSMITSAQEFKNFLSILA